MKTLVHVTHEAVHKVGGIGTVLQGLFTCRSYTDNVDRTILICPLFTQDGAPEDRLGPDGKVLYSSVDGWADHPASGALHDVQSRFHVDVVYGRRRFVDRDTGVGSDPEVLLIDVRKIHGGELNVFKAKLWERFKIESSRYENYWEFEEYARLAPPAIAALRALGACDAGACVILAHEFMGMPTALAAMIDGWEGFRTLFYAHEVAPMRKIVEDHPGHDTMFYNALARARQAGQYVEDVFGDQSHYFKYDLVGASRHCDNILAVGDYVVKELQFLSPEFQGVDIDLTYNGIPAFEISHEQKQASKGKLRRYAENLLGYRPDDVFTHVTRMATSKGLWRDLRVLEWLEPVYRQNDRTAVLFVLSTEVPPRRIEDIRHMEQWWKWPVAHREGLPDLSGGEAIFYAGVQEFNACSRNIKVVFVNQFGWHRDVCGERMPEDMDFGDIRRGSDAEFGQSIYEPFGIAQLEPLSFGAICVVSNVCGCAGFVEKITGGKETANVIVADYHGGASVPADAKKIVETIGREERNRLEHEVAQGVAEKLLAYLPKSESESIERIRSGYELARQMSWEVIGGDYFLPAVAKAIARGGVVQPV